MPMPPAMKRSFSARDTGTGQRHHEGVPRLADLDDLTHDQTMHLNGPATAPRDPPHRDPILPLLARIPAQRVLPLAPRREVEVDVRPRVPLRQLRAVRGGEGELDDVLVLRDAPPVHDHHGLAVDGQWELGQLLIAAEACHHRYEVGHGRPRHADEEVRTTRRGKAPGVVRRNTA